MRYLETLPTELPQHIGSYLIRDHRGALANLCAVNRRINDQLLDLLYSRYSTTGKTSELLFLRTICVAPRLAEKVQEVEIHRKEPEPEAHQWWETPNLSKEEFRKLADVYLSLRPPNRPLQYLFLRVLYGKEAPCLTLIFHVLPNVKKLILRGRADYLVANRIIQLSTLFQLRVLDVGALVDPKTTLTARTLRVLSLGVDWKPFLDGYRTILQLPSLQELVFTKLDVLNMGPLSFQGLWDFTHPGITKIAFKNCLVWRNMLRKFLRGCSQGIKSFEYSLDRDRFEHLRDRMFQMFTFLEFWDPMGMGTSLLQHKATLERLVLVNKNSQVVPRSLIGNLKEFTALKYLAINFTTLVNLQKPVDLSEILPQSLQKLEVYVGTHVYHASETKALEEVQALRSVCRTRFWKKMKNVKVAFIIMGCESHFVDVFLEFCERVPPLGYLEAEGCDSTEEHGTDDLVV